MPVVSKATTLGFLFCKLVRFNRTSCIIFCCESIPLRKSLVQGDTSLQRRGMFAVGTIQAIPPLQVALG